LKQEEALEACREGSRPSIEGFGGEMLAQIRFAFLQFELDLGA
jgi:hypothetical protein